MSETLKNKLYCLKTLCLVAIVFMHSPIDYLNDSLGKTILICFVQFGVYTFLILSAYFYSRTNKTFTQFWKTKLFSLIIPWFIAGFLNYSKTAFHNKQFSLLYLFYYVIGNRSFLYYLTILCVCYLLFWNLRKINLKTMLIFIVITFISKQLTVLGYIPDTSEGMHIYMNQYLNVFNYVGYFAFGIYLNNSKLLEKLDENFNNPLLVGMAMFAGIIICALLRFHFINANYYVWIFEIIFGMLLSCSLSFAFLYKVNVLVSIGKFTYPIYLYHLFLISRILTSDAALNSIICAIVRPVIVVIIMYLVLYFVWMLTKRNNTLNKLFIIVSGVRLK